ncbi:MAG: triose-phosphate isomerase [Gammaproteobacteria bacterium]|nr:triose-phosphate isomerase [Gammaproteobacteria bacterium]
MRIPLVAGNWKMNGDRRGVARLLDELLASRVADGAADVMVFPPYPYLPLVSERLAGTRIGWGAQNIADQDGGAFTGEVSGAMLRDWGCSGVLVGHSERRRIYAETDAVVAEKYAAARRAGLAAVICVGESLEERDGGRTLEVVRRQVEAVFARNTDDDFSTATFAYEPVWAIGTGRTATPEQAQEVHAFVRGLLDARAAGLGGRVRIVYGGSVTAGNAAQLFAMPDVDGGLVGGASLKADQFAAICAAAG